MKRLTKEVTFNDVELEIFGYGYYGRSAPTFDTVELVDVTVNKSSVYGLLSQDQIDTLHHKLLEEAVDCWQYDQSEHADRLREERYERRAA